MKSAFAKLLEKNPTQSSEVAFRAGGNGVPILTRASGQSTAGYQTMGLPGGSMPTPGGGNNKTTLGIYRMGEPDGNGAPSAIIGMPGDIFPPIAEARNDNPQRFFQNVGNNVFQPEDTNATHALLRRLGDQQFKATTMAPFEDYRAQERLARDLDEASRNAGLNDLGMSREIIRNLAAQRRQQNEDDYLRKMLDAGSTPEAARKEIEDVRNANALQEARKVDDREYQAKTLIQRMAMARGITPMVKEPLNQSSSIDNPQRSQAMSQAMGMPGEGFGTSPLDMNRQFMTPDFYKRMLRRSTLSQEAGDEQTAFNNLLTSGEIPTPARGSFSLATLRGQERQNQIELASEGLASRLETLRARGNRIINPLPANIVGKEVLDALYRNKGKVKTNRVINSLETIQDMRPLQLLIAMNLLTVKGGSSKVAVLKRSILEQGVLGNNGVPAQDLLIKLKNIVVQLNDGEPNVEIPFASDSSNLPMAKLLTILDDIKTSNNTALSREANTAKVEYMREIDTDEIPLSGNPVVELMRAVTTRRNRAGSPQRPQMDEAPVPGAPGVSSTAIVPFRGGGNTETSFTTRFVAPPQMSNFAMERTRQLLSLGRGFQNIPQELGSFPPPRRRITPTNVGLLTDVPRPPPRPKDNFDSMTLKQLKDELKKQGKPITVKNKDEAIARLRG